MTAARRARGHAARGRRPGLGAPNEATERADSGALAPGRARHGIVARMLYRAAALLLAALTSAPLAAQCSFSTPMATGCGYSSPFAIPTIACNGAPVVGNQSFALTTTAPCVGTPSGGLLLIGACLATPIQILDGPATGICVAQAFCARYLDPCVVLVGTPTSGGFSYHLPIPADPLLVGLQVCMQGVHTCTGLSCVAATNSAQVRVL